MPRDAAATRARILAAAVAEFSEHGLAGARIDRIAAEAGANKRMIYVYFASKEGLFAAALDDVIGELATAVPITENDLPGFAGRLFDYLVDHPVALRMGMWRHLERPSAGPDGSKVYAQKLEALADPAVTGSSDLPPMDLLTLVGGLASSWLTAPTDLLAAGGGDPYAEARLAEHRAAVVTAAERIVRP